MQKLDKLAKIWKKALEDESLQFFAGRFQGFSVKKMIILIRDVEAIDFSTASTASASASILQYKY